MTFAFVGFSLTGLGSGTLLLGNTSPRERKGGDETEGGCKSGPILWDPRARMVHQALNHPDDDGVLGPVMRSANSEMTGRRERDKSLLSRCFAVPKKHMEVFMELLEHLGGAVLAPPRQTASGLSVHPLSLGWECLGRHRVGSGCPCTQQL